MNYLILHFSECLSTGITTTTIAITFATTIFTTTTTHHSQMMYQLNTVDLLRFQK